MQSARRAGAPATTDVLVVERDAALRSELVAGLRQEPGLHLMAEVATLEEARLTTTRRCPRVVIADGDNQMGRCLKLCQEVSAERDDTRFVVYSSTPEQVSAQTLCGAGAAGVLGKEESVQAVVAGITAAARGLFVTSSVQSVAQIALPDTKAARATGDSVLTDRELEVLELMAEGLGNKEIAAHLFISENTVKNHVRSILDKFNAHSRMAAVVYAVRQRILNIT